jgi:ribosomal protein L18
VLRRFEVSDAVDLDLDIDLDIVRDAIRSNDPRLVVAAASRPVIAHLSDNEVGQALVKCVFMEVPLARVAGLTERAGADAADMLAGLVVERVTAGRSVSPDVWTIIDRYPPVDKLQALAELATSPVEEQRRAAVSAMSQRVQRVRSES